MVLKNKYIQLLMAAIATLGTLAFTAPLVSASAAPGNYVAATNLESLTDDSHKCKPASGQQLSKDNCGIVALVLIITNVLSGLVGVVIVMVIIIGGIQYSAAGGDPAAVAAARKRIMNAVMALVLFIFSFAILQWLVPGGLF